MEELDIKKLISIFWNKRLHIVAIVIVSMILGVIYSFTLVKPKYESYTTVLLVKDSKEGEDPEKITSSDLGLAKNLIGTYNELIKSRATLRATIDNLKINETEETLVKKITISQVKDAAMLKISIKDNDPVNAMRIANEITKVFEEKATTAYGLNNVRIWDAAEQPIVPCNINHVRDVLIFIVIGIVIAVVYVLIANMFDTTIKDASDVENNSELITLVSIPFVNEEKGGIN